MTNSSPWDLPTKHKFTYDEIKHFVPLRSGVYFLCGPNELTYIGMSQTNIEFNLLRHFDGYEGPCTEDALEFSFEEHPNPAERETELLQLCMSKNQGKLPKCNG